MRRCRDRYARVPELCPPDASARFAGRVEVLQRKSERERNESRAGCEPGESFEARRAGETVRTMPPYETVVGVGLPVNVCMGTTQGGTCVCPDGWVHDGVLFHLANCSQPAMFVPVYAGVTIFLCAVLEVMLVPRLRNTRRRSPARTVLLGAQVSLASLVAAMVALLIQGYGGPALFAMLAISAQSISVSLTMTIVTYARILYSVAQQTFPEGLFRLAFVLSVTLLGTPFWFVFLPGSIIGETDAAQWNIMFAVGILLVPLQLVVTAPILFVASGKLITTIEETNAKLRGAPRKGSKGQDAGSSGGTGVSASTGPIGGPTIDQKMQSLVRRLALFRRAMVVIVAGEISFTTSTFLVYVTLRSPYNWVLAILLLTSVVGSVAAFVLTTSERAVSSGPGSPKHSTGHVGRKKDSSTANSSKERADPLSLVGMSVAVPTSP